ncbi:branched-subunit amino acid transport protein AzlD [Clostridium beijerinckii]|nr:branched-subunit amino acid transport protein AzlD [Clostridium beijerinckii]NRY59655.1 branched-subunit amino acid transport protein AzlD [Clostridium beijerinckii]
MEVATGVILVLILIAIGMVFRRIVDFNCIKS